MARTRSIISFLVGVVILGMAVPFATMWVIEPLAGDLTRIGALPEREFGWNGHQPDLYRRTNNVAGGQADVLVVGDSFSGLGFWQPAAFGERIVYATFSFGRICADFGALLKDMKLSPRIVVVQTVERLFEQRFFSSCDKSQLAAAAGNSTTPIAGARDREIFYRPFGAKYAIGSLRYFAFGGEQFRAGHSGGVHVLRVADGCSLFTNRDCEYSLFLGDDLNLPAIPLNRHESPMIEYLKAAGIERIIVLPIPNKYQTYFQSLEEARASDEYLREFALRNDVEILPLHERFVDDKRRVRDLYLPNDTHLSPAGMRLLGRYVAECCEW